MLSPTPDQVNALVNDLALTPEQKIVRETTFYRENIAPLIIGDANNDKPIVFIEERTTINSGADTASMVDAYYQEMQLVADLAGHDDFFKNKKIIFIINEGNYHWTASVKDKDADNITPRTDVTTDGTCGLSSALIACDEILKTPYLNVTKYQIAIGALSQPSNNEVILNHVPAGKQTRVATLLTNRLSANWLETDDIRDIIIHNERNNSQIFQSHNSSNAQNRKNQINFATALNNPDLNSYVGDFSDLSPSGVNHYRSVQYFYEELDQTKLQDFLSHHSKRTDLTDDAKINLYKICEQYSVFKEGNKKIKHGLDAFDRQAEIDQEISQLRLQKEKENKEYEENKKKFKQSSQDVIKYLRENFCKITCERILTKTEELSGHSNIGFDEKLLNLSSLHEMSFLNNLRKQDLPSLPQNILKIIVPKSCQPDTQDYKGWGKVIDSKMVDGKTTLEFDGKIIKSIEIDGEDKLKKILELKNSFLINCAILDLLRNTENKDITVNFTDSKQPAETFISADRKTIIKNQVVEDPNEKQKKLLTETHLDVAKRIYVEKISEKEKFLEASPDDFKNIKEHIEERFKLLEKQLSSDTSNAIIVIPGSYDANGTFKHELGTGYAPKQWGNKIYSDEIKDFIEKKIITLRSNHSGKVFFGNIGTETVKILNDDGSLKQTFYPQFPVGDQNDQTWDEFEKKFKKNIEQISDGDKKALIKNYETNLGWNDISKAPIHYTAVSIFGDDAKLDHILTHLKTNFTDKSFIHVWGANANNWNCSLNSWKGGGGQATAFKTQERGVFGITTTPVAGSKDLMKPCKTYGAPSAEPANPQAITAAATAAAGRAAGGT